MTGDGKYLRAFAAVNPRIAIGVTILSAITIIEGLLAYSGYFA